MADSHWQLYHLKQDLEIILAFGDKLSVMVKEFKTHLAAIPDSCTLSGITKPVMVHAIESVDRSSASIYMSVDRMQNTLRELPREINVVLGTQVIADILVIVIPFIPTIVEMLSTVMIVVVAFLSFFSPKPEIAERAVRALTRFGAKGFASLITLAGVMAALYLEVGIVAGNFCLDVDENILGVVRNIDWTAAELDHGNRTARDVNGAAQFYVKGTGSNPLEEAALNIKSNIDTLADARNSTRWMESVAGAFCPALHDFNAEYQQAKATSDIQKLRDFLLAKHVWPYYDSVVHDAACARLPEHLMHLILCNIVVGFVMIPVLAVTFQIDLKRMIAYKTDANFSDEDEDDESDDDAPFLDTRMLSAPKPVSAPTYTHKTKTTAKHARDGPRTFLA